MPKKDAFVLEAASITMLNAKFIICLKKFDQFNDVSNFSMSKDLSANFMYL